MCSWIYGVYYSGLIHSFFFLKKKEIFLANLKMQMIKIYFMTMMSTALFWSFQLFSRMPEESASVLIYIWAAERDINWQFIQNTDVFAQLSWRLKRVCDVNERNAPRSWLCLLRWCSRCVVLILLMLLENLVPPPTKQVKNESRRTFLTTRPTGLLYKNTPMLNHD